MMQGANNTAKAPLKLGAEGEPVIGSDIQTDEDWWDVVVDSTAFIAANDTPRPVDQFEIITKTAGIYKGHPLVIFGSKREMCGELSSSCLRFWLLIVVKL